MMPTEQEAIVQFPTAYVDDLIDRVSDLAELKLALYIGLRSSLGNSPLVPMSALEDPRVPRSILGDGSPRPSTERLKRVLDQAVADAIIIRVTVREESGDRTWLGIATVATRGFVERLRAGEAEAEETLSMSPRAGLIVERPNVFALYERSIGPLTPLIAEELRDAEKVYPQRWIEDAMATAVDYNKRNWRYVQSILRNWEEAGAPNAITRRHSEES